MLDKENYYVVDTKAPPAPPADVDIPDLPATGVPLRLYFRTDSVEQVDIKQDGVQLLYQTLDGEAEALFYPSVTDAPNIQRRSELVNYRYRFNEGGNGTVLREYAGAPFW